MSSNNQSEYNNSLNDYTDFENKWLESLEKGERKEYNTNEEQENPIYNTFYILNEFFFNNIFIKNYVTDKYSFNNIDGILSLLNRLQLQGKNEIFNIKKNLLKNYLT